MALVFSCLGVPTSVQASPTSAINPVVQLGSGSVDGIGTAHVTVHQATQLLGINWTSLGNNPGEVLQFIQPSANAIALNRVTGADPSQFLGSLSANGAVIVINPNGVFFGPQSQVNVNGLIASSLNITDSDFLKGRYAFQGAAANGAVRNEGQITAGSFGGYLLAPNVTNNGVIKSPGGHIALVAGTTAYLSNRADGRGFLVEVTAPAGEALNLKDLVADGGQVSMIGRLVTQSGLVQANSVRQQNGRIELVASNRVELTAGSMTSAKGTDQNVSDGGSILVKSDLTTGETTFRQGAVLDVSGGANGGNGGFAEVSGASLTLRGQFLARAMSGYTGGRFLIDPTTVTTSDLQPFSGSGASVIEFVSPDGTDLTVSVNYNLFNVGPLSSPEQIGSLRFNAGNNLLFNSTTIQNGQNNGTGATNGWNIVGTAKNDIVFNSAILSTSKGGGISLDAKQDIKLVPDGGGGLTTLRTFGGDIEINAVRDLSAPFARQTNGQYAGIRLQGSGNLTINAGRDFLGGVTAAGPAGPGFLLSNGTAQVNVGGNLGSVYVPGSPTTTGPPNGYANFMLGSGALDLTTFQVVPGSQGIAKINVTAGNNIYLGNVQDVGAAEGFGRGAFNAVTVNPENSAKLTAQTGNIFLNPLDVDLDLSLTHVMPPTFSAAATNGSIFIQSNLDFWPSAGGNVAFSAGNNIQGTLVPGAPGTIGTPTNVTLCGGGFQCPDIATGLAQQPGSISFTTARGDISTLNLQLYSPVVTKSVTISSGRDITKTFGQSITVPDLGLDAAGHPIPGATISAVRDIDLTTPITQFGVSGFTLVGTGTARISAGRTLDLANSQGIIQRVNLSPSTDSNKGGLLDITVGGDLNMDKSRVLTENGGSIWIHGIGQDQAVDALGHPTLFNGQPVILQAGTQQGPNGMTVVVDGTPVLFNGKPLVLSGSEPVITPGSLLLDHFPTQTLNGSSVVPVLHHAKAILVDGKLVFLIDGQVTLVDARTVSIERPVGGQVLVGTNQNNFSDQTGILTTRGGAIEIKAMGNVDVERSRIASFGGGAITITSTAGDISAGSGGKDQVVFFVIDQGIKKDAQGNPVIDPGTGQPVHVLFSAKVPGSGIFTFHPDDPFPLKFPVFNPISPFEAQVALHQFMGHDVTTMLPKIPAAHDAWIARYNQIFDKFIAPLKLGDVTLNAARDVVVPPAGIRGRLVTINTGRNLDLNGGTIEGRTNVTAGGAVIGSLSSFVGAFTVNLGGSIGGTGGGGTMGLGSVSGSVGSVTTTSAVTASASVTSATTQSTIREAATPQLVRQPKAALGSPGTNAGEGSKAASLRIKDKVKIKIETRSERAM